MATTQTQLPPDVTWKRITLQGEKPKQRRYSTGVLYQNELVLFGGTGPDKSSKNDLWYFNVDNLSWSEVKTPSAPPARYGHSAVIHEDKMYVFGGTTDGKVGLNDVWAFDLKAKTWEEIKADNGPSPRYHHSCVNKIFFSENQERFIVRGGYLTISNHLPRAEQFFFCF